MLKFFLSFANSHQINKLEQDFFWNLEELLWWKAVRTKTCCRRCVRTPISSCPFYICRNATTFSNYSTSAASKNAEEGKNSRRLKRRHRVCYFVFSVSPVEALQAMLASPLVKMILLTVRQPRPGRGREDQCQNCLQKARDCPAPAPLLSVFEFWIIYLLLLIYWFLKNSSDSLY